MNENFSNEKLLSKAKSLLNTGSSFSDIENVLFKDGIDESQIKEIINKVVSYKNNKRLGLGFKIILIGVAFLVSSCTLSIVTDYSNPNFIFLFYGLTSIGTCIVMGGFIIVFG